VIPGSLTGLLGSIHEERNSDEEALFHAGLAGCALQGFGKPPVF